MSTYAPAFLDALESLEIGSWEGDVWRQTIGNTDPRRPNARGARWNPPDEDALYCALTTTGAQAELASMIARQPVKIRRNLRTHQLVVRLSRVADIRGSDALEQFGYPPPVFVADDWGPPQEIGGAAAWLGFGGLLVPSARHSDGNLVIFINRIAPTDMVDLLGPVDHE